MFVLEYYYLCIPTVELNNKINMKLMSLLTQSGVCSCKFYSSFALHVYNGTTTSLNLTTVTNRIKMRLT